MAEFIKSIPVQVQCRLCSKIADKYYNALTNASIRDCVRKFMNLEIEETDLYSKLICEPCVCRITEFDSYCTEVIQYQQFLHIVHIESSNGNENCVRTIQVPFISENQKHIVIVQRVIQAGESSANLNPTIEQNNESAQMENAEQAHQHISGSQGKPSIISEGICPSNQTKEHIKQNENANSKHELSENVSSDESIGDNDIDSDDYDDGDEDDLENSDNDEFDENVQPQAPNHIQLNEFPAKLIDNGKFLIKGTELIDLISKFYVLECDYCTDESNRVIYEDLPALLQHYVSDHRIKGYVVCCNIKLVKIRAMGMHLARHLQPDAFKCPECQKIMSCPKILQYHIQNHLPESKRPLACGQCPRRFSYSSALVAHSISHQPEHERAAHICDECGREFKSAGRLTTHINVKHMTHANQEYVCSICSKQFTYACNLAYHMTTHQPYTKQVQCEKCGKWLKNKFCLRKHMYQHSAVRYNCTVCTYSTLNQQCLKNHMRVQHTDDKPFQCSDCGKAFKLKTTLAAHISQHTGDRNYMCEFCNRWFASSGNYYSHRKRMHPSELAAVKHQQEEERRRLRESKP